MSMGEELLAVAVVLLLILAAAVCLAVLARCMGRERGQEGISGQGAEEETAAAGEQMKERFLPLKLFEILGVERLQGQPESLLGERMKLRAGILNINIAGFQESIIRMEEKEVFRLINSVLSCCIPEIYQAGGSVDHFMNAGVTALFTENAEMGLNAAVSICEKIGRLSVQEREYERFSIGICYGDVMIGMVGHDERMSVLTLSAYTGFGEFLQQIAPKYYAKILASGSYVEQIENCSARFNSRFLGYMYISSSGTAEKVYDIFDGDIASVRNQKRKTRMVFEKGVGLFLERSFAEARLYFIEVLKADRYDRAAMEYVLLCDKYSNAEEKNKAGIYIEVY